MIVIPDRHTVHQLTHRHHVAVKQTRNVAPVVVHVHQAAQVPHHPHHQVETQVDQARAVHLQVVAARLQALHLTTDQQKVKKELVHRGKLMIKNESHRIQENVMIDERDQQVVVDDR